MRLHLIDHRLDAGKGADVNQPVRIEVGNADRLDDALGIQILQCSPRAVNIRERLMQKHQINVVGFQLAHGFQHRLPRLVVPIMLHPDLGGQEDLTSRYA